MTVRAPVSAGVALLVTGAVVLLTLAGCAGSTSGHPAAAGRASTTTRSTASTTTTRPGPGVTVQAAPWRLPHPSARAVLLPDGPALLLLGGLDGSGGNTDQILHVDPATGAATTAGSLTLGVHDAAGARLGGTAFVFGGGAAAETDRVQRFAGTGTATTVGRLPVPRSDLGAAVVGGRAYLVGGFDGSRVRATALSTADGVTFAVLGDLPVPVRYPAVVASGTDVLLFGGVTATTDAPAADTDAVQALDTRTGTARIVTRLPHSLAHASAVTLRGRVYVLGGRWAGVPSAQVWQWDPTTTTLVPVATLPSPVTDGAVTTIGDRAYLAGGDAPEPTSAVAMVTAR